MGINSRESSSKQPSPLKIDPNQRKEIALEIEEDRQSFFRMLKSEPMHELIEKVYGALYSRDTLENTRVSKRKIGSDIIASITAVEQMIYFAADAAVNMPKEDDKFEEYLKNTTSKLKIPEREETFLKKMISDTATNLRAQLRVINSEEEFYEAMDGEIVGYIEHSFLHTKRRKLAIAIWREIQARLIGHITDSRMDKEKTKKKEVPYIEAINTWFDGLYRQFGLDSGGLLDMILDEMDWTLNDISKYPDLSKKYNELEQQVHNAMNVHISPAEFLKTLEDVCDSKINEMRETIIKRYGADRRNVEIKLKQVINLFIERLRDQFHIV